MIKKKQVDLFICSLPYSHNSWWGHEGSDSAWGSCLLSFNKQLAQICFTCLVTPLTTLSWDPERNHTGATNFPDKMGKYLKKECTYGAIIGPFFKNPFKTDMVISPLNSVPNASHRDSMEFVCKPVLDRA
jgi:hypothetical protein